MSRLQNATWGCFQIAALIFLSIGPSNLFFNTDQGFPREGSNPDIHYYSSLPARPFYSSMYMSTRISRKLKLILLLKSEKRTANKQIIKPNFVLFGISEKIVRENKLNC